MLTISIFRPSPHQENPKRRNNTQAETARISWPMLAQRLGNPPSGEFKEARGAWSPATYRDGKKSNANVLSVDCVVLDVDGKGLSFDKAVSLLSGRSTIIHTSWSHGIKGDCYRVVFECTRSILPDEYPDIWAFSEASLPGVDGSCKDAGRLWWLPVKREGFRCVVNYGAKLDVDLALEAQGIRKTLIELSGKVAATFEPPTAVLRIGQDRQANNAYLSNAEKGAIAWLSRRAPAIDKEHGGGGAQGNAHGWNTFQKLVRGFDLGANLTPAVWDALLAWNAQCKRPWHDYELKRELRNADTNGRMVRGEMLREYAEKYQTRGAA